MRDVFVPTKDRVGGRARLRQVPRLPFMRQLLPPPLMRQKLAPGKLPFGWHGEPEWDSNDWLYEWGSIAGPLLIDADARYRISGMYLEFENVADPDDEVAAPEIVRSSGRAYYDSLIDSEDRDYLRVPIIATSSELIGDTINSSQGLRIRWFAQSSGVVGAHGKEFSDAVNSKIIGGALVAQVSAGDATQDLILSRFYAAPERQLVKLPSGQVGAEWETILR